MKTAYNRHFMISNIKVDQDNNKKLTFTVHAYLDGDLIVYLHDCSYLEGRVSLGNATMTWLSSGCESWFRNSGLKSVFPEVDFNYYKPDILRIPLA
jgi:hypothetical protein